jgi:hypothetical protein
MMAIAGRPCPRRIPVPEPVIGGRGLGFRGFGAGEASRVLRPALLNEGLPDARGDYT